MTKKQIAKYVASMFAVSMLLASVTWAVDVLVGEWAGWTLVGALFTYGVVQAVRAEIRTRRSDAA